MSEAATRTGVTVRFDPETRERLRAIAEQEHRSVAAYLEMLVRRDLAARAEAERVIRVHVAPDLDGVPLGTIRREPGESDARYKRRSAALNRVFGIR